MKEGTKVRLNIPEGMSDEELATVLEKALTKLNLPYSEPNRDFPDALGNAIRDQANTYFDVVIQNMISEISEVLTRQN